MSFKTKEESDKAMEARQSQIDKEAEEESQEHKFKVGQAVRLSCKYSHAMSIVDIGLNSVGQPICECSWFDINNHLQTARFLEEALEGDK